MRYRLNFCSQIMKEPSWDRKMLGQETVRTEEGEDRSLLLGQKRAGAGAPGQEGAAQPHW